MLFHDRKDAGLRLSEKLKSYKKNKDTIVLGIPRGGIVVAYEIAKELHLPLGVIITKKMGAPYNPELAIGAVDEEGNAFINEDVCKDLGVSKEYLNQEKEKEQKKAKLTIKKFCKNKKLLSLKNKTAILVDDGLATGASMMAAIHSAKKKQAKKIIVAVPVGALESVEKISHEADEVVCLEAPSYFGAVSTFYTFFNQTTDEEVVELLHSL
ncbi:MAG: phosphoribosyltransferase [Deltaproteobacteria bacterium]|nr:phosphoribosyltransferase [Deltaproteobacteria bacterium]